MYSESASKRVLVIDDDPGLQRQLRFRLELHERVSTEQAFDGITGLILAQRGTPDLVILDWMLPDIQGPEMIDRLKENKKTADIPILMLTGRYGAGDRETARELGANDLLRKPCSLRSVGKKVSVLLTGQTNTHLHTTSVESDRRRSKNESSTRYGSSWSKPRTIDQQCGSGTLFRGVYL